MTDAEKVAALESALTEIRELLKPGQELDISGAIDVLCDVWNTARKALED